ncbi:hypothetical protein NECAME_08927 [Necator americanus]|uniref:Uncharacterized protein n=1 Tax=Necator americanus TaxID=51031 RepID=W2TG58_NECAM|nr:hypothetical protein NECAME_08927 [Necator americanus]ETN80793.1 hypothetical protein NECAME_08927 [Necator americanus]
MCGVWTTPNEMFKHLETVEHKLAYLFRNYKMYHQTVVSETNALVREAMLSQFAIQIWKMEKPPGQVSNRLRSLLDRSTIERIWPEHVDVLDHSWKESGIEKAILNHLQCIQCQLEKTWEAFVFIKATREQEVFVSRPKTASNQES